MMSLYKSAPSARRLLVYKSQATSRFIGKIINDAMVPAKKHMRKKKKRNLLAKRQDK
jgi:hypothetical protein